MSPLVYFIGAGWLVFVFVGLAFCRAAARGDELWRKAFDEKAVEEEWEYGETTLP